MATDTSLSEELMEEIFTQLPLQSLGRASCVCKQWQSLTTSPAFLALHGQKHDQQSWLYVNGYKYKVVTGPPSLRNSLDSSFSQDQLQDLHNLSSPPPGCDQSRPSLWGPGGICYGMTGSSNSSEASPSHSNRIVYKTGVLEKEWVQTPELNHKARILPIVAILKNYQTTGAHQIICMGGLASNDEGMESAESSTSSLKVEIYTPESGVWEDCEDLPEEFKGVATVRTVTVALHKQKLYTFHIHSGMVASFDTATKRWSKAKKLQPPGEGAQYGYLVVENGELLLIGVTYEEDRFAFKAWRVDEASMECIGMPQPVMCHFAEPTTSRKMKTSKLQSEVVATTRSMNDDDDKVICKKNLHHGMDNNSLDHHRIHVASIWPLLHLEANFFTAGSRILHLASLLRQWVL